METSFHDIQPLPAHVGPVERAAVEAIRGLRRKIARLEWRAAYLLVQHGDELEADADSPRWAAYERTMSRVVSARRELFAAHANLGLLPRPGTPGHKRAARWAMA